jgi:hypothetical protein
MVHRRFRQFQLGRHDRRSDYRPPVLNARAENEIVLLSPLSPGECGARLREATDCFGPMSWFGSRPVIGRVSGRSVQLSKRIVHKHSRHCMLFGSLDECDEGTVFRGRTCMDPVFVAFNLIGIVILIAAVVSIAAGAVVRPPGPLPMTMMVPLLAIGIFALWVRRRLVPNERQFLIDFVADVIDARSAECRPTSASR